MGKLLELLEKLVRAIFGPGDEQYTGEPEPAPQAPKAEAVTGWEGGPPYRYIDVSRYQGLIDWDAVVKSGLIDGVMLRTRRTLRKSHSKEVIMASTTYEHFVDTNKMYDAQEQFRDLTKMVCARFRGLTKTYHLGNANKLLTFCHRFAVLGNMVRNAGQLPQPFWIGAARGGGSRGTARCAART